MRQSIGAMALMRSREAGRTRWLAQWNAHWQGYHFVGGHKRPAESFRQCLIREVAEELGLQESTDFTVAGHPLAHLEYVAWSERAREETQYTMELFAVELTEGARAQVDADPGNRWLSTVDIRTRRCEDGKPVSETMERLLSLAGLCQSNG